MIASTLNVEGGEIGPEAVWRPIGEEMLRNGLREETIHRLRLALTKTSHDRIDTALVRVIDNLRTEKRLKEIIHMLVNDIYVNV